MPKTRGAGMRNLDLELAAVVEGMRRLRPGAVLEPRTERGKRRRESLSSMERGVAFSI